MCIPHSCCHIIRFDGGQLIGSNQRHFYWWENHNGIGNFLSILFICICGQIQSWGQFVFFTNNSLVMVFGGKSIRKRMEKRDNYGERLNATFQSHFLHNLHVITSLMLQCYHHLLLRLQPFFSRLFKMVCKGHSADPINAIRLSGPRKSALRRVSRS